MQCLAHSEGKGALASLPVNRCLKQRTKSKIRKSSLIGILWIEQETTETEIIFMHCMNIPLQ